MTLRNGHDWQTALKCTVIRARFADAVWELGKLLGSSRNDFHLYGQMAAELYVDAADAAVTPQNSFCSWRYVARGISLGMQFRRPELS